MQQGFYRAGLTFSYPANASSLDIVRAVKHWASYAPTLEKFPWRIASVLSDCFTHPNAGFAFAELILFCKAESARRIFQPHMSSYHRLMLEGVLKHRPQFSGIFYEHLRYWVKHWLRTRQLTDWPECEGLSPYGYGNRRVPPREVDQNRRDLLAVIAQATRWYERTMAKIGNSDDLADRASGRELEYWVRGALLPQPMLVPVTILAEHEDGLLIGPDKEASKPFLDAGWELPEYPVETDEVEFEALPPPPPKPAPVANEPAIPKPEIPAGSAPADDIRQTAAKALELATRLDDNPKVKAPNHLTVFRLYCVDALPLREIARRCKCSHATIINRKTALESRLRLPLDSFRGRDEEVRPLTGAAQYAKARRISPGRLIQ